MPVLVTRWFPYWLAIWIEYTPQKLERTASGLPSMAGLAHSTVRAAMVFEISAYLPDSTQATFETSTHQYPSMRRFGAVRGQNTETARGTCRIGCQ